jgi:hypothetical protein
MNVESEASGKIVMCERTGGFMVDEVELMIIDSEYRVEKDQCDDCKNWCNDDSCKVNFGKCFADDDICKLFDPKLNT